MKKLSKKLMAIIVITVSLILILSLALSFIPHTRYLGFADTIVITDNQADGGAKSIEISKEADADSFEQIFSLCSSIKSTIHNPFSMPACMFERYEIEFKKGNKSITVIPSNDDCNTMLMQIEEKKVYYYIDEADKQKLDTVLETIM